MNTKMIIGVLAIGGLFVLIVSLSGNKNEEGEMTMNENAVVEESVVSLPADMPTNVPMYPGAIVTNVQEVEQDGVRNITLSLTTEDSVADVNTWYRGALNENNWSVTSDQNVGGYVLLKGENENTATFMQAANRSDLGVVVITQRVQVR
jgi:hypothetical protein